MQDIKDRDSCSLDCCSIVSFLKGCYLLVEGPKCICRKLLFDKESLELCMEKDVGTRVNNDYYMV